MTGEALLRSIEADFIVQRRSSHASRVEAGTELDALGRLQAHQGMREASIKLAIPLHMAAQPNRKPGRDDFDDTAECISGLLAGIDLFDNRALCRRIRNAHLRFLSDEPQFRHAQIGGSFRDRRTDTHAVPENIDSERSQELPRETANRDARGSLTRRGAFENVADIFKIIFQNARKVRVTGTRTRHDFGFPAIARISRHPLFPILEVAIYDDEGDGAAQCAPEADTRNWPRLILLDEHPAPAPVTFLAARKVVVNLCEVDFESRWHAFDNGDQLGAVRFARG